MDLGREVSPDLASEIESLAEDEVLNDELARLKREMQGGEESQPAAHN